MASRWQQVSEEWQRGTVDMRLKNMSDADVADWCRWFTCHHLSAANPGRVFKVFDFSNNFISDAGARILLRTLKEAGIRVKILRLYGNKLTSTEPFIDYVRWSQGKLHELHLSNNLFDADAVCELVMFTVTVTNREGDSYYPIQGSTPLWLRVGGGLRPSYAPEVLENSLRQRLENHGRSFARDIHVIDDTNVGCNPTKCCLTSPTPAVHAPYLFPHWKKQVPSLLKQVTKGCSINHPPIVPTAVKTSGGICWDMSRRGIRDEDLPGVFDWMKHRLQEMTREGICVRLKEVDMSKNRLTTAGLIQVLRFLRSQKIHLEVLKQSGNASVHGEDVDFTLSLGGYGVKASKRCPLRTGGCICGKGCETCLDSGLLHEYWFRRVDFKKGKVNMCNAGIDDRGMSDWCAWFSGLGHESHGLSNLVVDFSVNYLTDAGVNELVDMLMDRRVKVAALKLFDNKICMDYGGVIQRFLTWNCGALVQLHLSKNQLTTNAIADILVAAINLRTEEGETAYPYMGQRPLWFRADINSYDSEELEEQLREALSNTSGAGTFETCLCHVTHAGSCKPWKCENEKLMQVPAVHGVYLFKHWERLATQDESRSEKISCKHARINLEAEKAQYQSALHALGNNMGPVSVMQPHAQPVLDAIEQKQQLRNLAPIAATCPGFYRPKAKTLQNIAGAPSTSGRPNCFTPQTLFRRANIDSYVSVAELRQGDLLVGPGGSGIVVESVEKCARRARNMVSLQMEHSDRAFVLTSDHRVQVDLDGTCMSAGRIFQEFQDGNRPQVSDGTQLHAVKKAVYKKQVEAVVMVKFEGDGAAFVWLRPRRWRSRSADCPRLAVRGEHPDLHVAASGPQEQEMRHGITSRNSFIQDWVNTAVHSRRSRSLPPRETKALLE